MFAVDDDLQTARRHRDLVVARRAMHEHVPARRMVHARQRRGVVFLDRIGIVFRDQIRGIRDDQHVVLAVGLRDARSGQRDLARPRADREQLGVRADGPIGRIADRGRVELRIAGIEEGIGWR